MIDIKKVIKIVTTYVLLTDIHQRSHSTPPVSLQPEAQTPGIDKKERNARN